MERIYAPTERFSLGGEAGGSRNPHVDLLVQGTGIRRGGHHLSEAVLVVDALLTIEL